MKKLIYTLFLALPLLSGLQAQQIADHALGLRFGGSNGFGAEVSYQNALGGNNRLEVDLGFRDDSNVTALKLAGIYQWVWRLDGNINWFAGAGGGLGNANYSSRYDNPKFRGSNQFMIFAAGNLGLEYNFDFPLLLAVDFRPEIGSSDYINGLDFDIALSLRYQF